MANPEARRMAQQATYALQQGEAQQALNFIDQAIGIEPGNADHHIVRGVTLAHLRMPDEATGAFQTAIQLAPGDAKTHYNLAVHLHSLGRNEEALAAGREALRLDTGHSAAAGLVRQLEGPPGFQTPMMSPPAEGPGHALPPQQYAPYAQGPMPPPPVHTGIPFVRSLGKAWDAAMWLLIVSGALIAFGLISAGFRVQSQFGKLDLMDLDRFFEVLEKDSQYTTLSLLALGVAALSLVWMILDVIDRRSSGWWMVPFALCCLCQLQWLIAPIYMLAGRKSATPQ